MTDIPWPGDHPRSTKGRDMQVAFAEQLRVAKERHVVWTEVTLPDGGRADVFAFRPWGKFKDQTIYEIKASRSDFWNDVNKGKYRRYLPHCHRLFFVVPHGLVKKSEVPEGCGLIVRQPHGGFRVVVPAVRREVDDPPVSWLWGLLDRTWFQDTRKVRDLKERVTFESNGEIRPKSWLWGDKTRKRIAQAEMALEQGGAVTSEHRNALYLAERILTLSREAGIKPRYRGQLDEGDLAHLAESAVRLLQATDRVQAIGQYLLHFNPREGGRVDSYVLGGEPDEVAEDDISF